MIASGLRAVTLGLRVCPLCRAVGDARGVAEDRVLICSRCGRGVHARKMRSTSRAGAFLIAAIVLYVPANTYPVMYTKLLGSQGSSTILGGIVEFWNSGSWDIALLIFLASVAVPCSKFLSLGYLLLDRRVDEPSLIGKTRLLKFVEFIGYWSMLDVLVVAIVVALIQFKAFGVAEPQPGIVFFGAVVVLTMLSALSFDLRLLWDRHVAHV